MPSERRIETLYKWKFVSWFVPRDRKELKAGYLSREVERRVASGLALRRGKKWKDCVGRASLDGFPARSKALQQLALYNARSRG
jgi:hypothetical protein